MGHEQVWQRANREYDAGRRPCSGAQAPRHARHPEKHRIAVGKQTYWARDSAHKDQILKGLKGNAKPEVSRFKGLGEMDPKELFETTLDPRTRTLLKVDIEGHEDALFAHDYVKVCFAVEPGRSLG